MSLQEPDDDTVEVERRDEGLVGLWIDGAPVGKIIQGLRERVDDLEHDNDELRADLLEVRGTAKAAETQASSVANAVENQLEAHGGQGQKAVARDLVRDLVVKRTSEGLNAGPRNPDGTVEDVRGSVEVAEVPTVAQPRDVAWTSAKRAARDLPKTWSVLEFDEDENELRATTSRNFPRPLVEIVEQSLDRDDRSNLVVGGGD